MSMRRNVAIRRKMSVALVAAVLVFAGAFLSSARAVLWAPPSVVRGRLLLGTPRGHSKNEVLTYVAEKGYPLAESSGQSTQRPNGYPVPGSFADYVTVDIGYYRVLWRVDVQAIYTFDKNGRLQDIVVKRFADAP